MQKIILLLLAAMALQYARAQHSFKARVKDGATRQALPGATISLGKNKPTAVADSSGWVELKNVPAGRQTIIVSHQGYAEKISSFIFPIPDTVEIGLDAESEELEEVVIESTRTSRTIANTPTRVETIDGEELDEKNNMRPANVSMLLHESTGMQVQQTSATSGNASIRVQGLDGRYTQLLKDGYPNFGNFAGGLSILEIPPLDLRQVEVIKGPASTLYGGGAIAGVVNFISKTPKEAGEYLLMLNQSHIGQQNIGGFAAQKKDKWGYSLMGIWNRTRAYDVDRDDFSEIPKGTNFTIHPRLYFYPGKSISLMLGHSLTHNKIEGGDMQVIDGKGDLFHTYFENNKTRRNTTTLEIEKKSEAGMSWKLKQSLSIFDREISIPDFNFAGVNTNSFTDLSFLKRSKNHTLIGGMNLVWDRFREKNVSLLDAESFTTGFYLQDTWDISEKVKMESGLRMDHAVYQNIRFKKNNSFLLPRISMLFRLTNQLTSRIGAGLGYKLPTIFTEQSEARQYFLLDPLDNVEPEKSLGGTIDLDYKTRLADGLSFSINQLFFYTRINQPLVLQPSALGTYFFANAAQPVTSQGFETNLKFIYRNDLKFFVGYTFTNAKARYLPANPFLPLLPRHKINLTWMYEKEDNFKLGLEAYFTDRQFLTNGSRTPSYWELGFMAQKTWGKFSPYINFENFTDQRQSRTKPVANPPHSSPVFDEIWNHTEGFVVNGGVKIRF